MRKVFLIAVAALLASAASAQGQQWRVCNQTPEVIRVAVGYHTPGNRPVKTEGWFRPGPCGGCATVLYPSETSDHRNVFLRVEDRNGNATVDGSRRMCVSSKKFTISGDHNCEGRNFLTKGFQHTEIDLRKNFTTNITGRRRCNM